MITFERFRRFEAVLLGLLDPDAASVVCDIIAAAIEGAPPEAPRNRSSILINAGGIDLGTFALQSGLDRQSAYESLVAAGRMMKSVFGFEIIDSLSFCCGGTVASGTVFKLSPAFSSMVDGTELIDQGAGKTSRIRPDAATRKAIDILAASAASASGLRFLWRIAAAPGSACEKLEIDRMAENLKTRAGDTPVLLMRPGKGGITATALSASLHLDVSSVLIFPLESRLFKAATETHDHDEDDDDFCGPADERPIRYKIESSGAGFLKILPALSCTTILLVPGETILEPEVASCFSGSFGPYRLDRASALADIKAQALNILGDRQAGLVLQAASDPVFAHAILRGAGVIAKAP